jgi:hypothetical protein
MPHPWNNIIVVTADELVPKFYNTLSTLRSEIDRYKKFEYGIKKVRRGGNGGKMLIAFDSLPKETQDVIGDPRKVKNPLDLFYKTDATAVIFYNTFRFEDNTALSLKHIEEYVTNASVLRAAILLKQAREHERKTKGGSCKGVMATICNDVINFNKSLQTNFNNTAHTLPASEKRFKETFKEFENGFNYSSLISGKLKNENRKLVTDELLQFLNDLFATQSHKPTRTEVAKQYDSFLSGYIEVINNETGELYEPKNFKPLSEQSVINYLNRWEDKVATHRKRSGDRQKYMGNYKPYHSLDRPQYAGSIISVDDRQPPFKYDNLNNRVWFYNGIDLGSEAFVCWVYGKSKEGIITEFYRQLIRNYVSWGINLPFEIEAESNLNSSFVNTFLKPGAMFNEVRIEANNARGKRIERYFGNLRYGTEKQREGWLARPHAKSEANQAGNTSAPIIPYNTIVQNSLKDIEDWNNSPHSVHTDKTRWEVFMQMQHPQLQPINWNAILPYLGYKTQTKCQLNGIINLNNEEYLLGLDGEVLIGDTLITMMKIVAGENIDVYWLDGNNGEAMKALIYLRNTDRIICEAVLKPTYNRATLERTEIDKKNYEIMSAYVATIEGYAKMKASRLNNLTVIDNRQHTLNRGFVIDDFKRYMPTQEQEYKEPEIINVFPEDEDGFETIPVDPKSKGLRHRF